METIKKELEILPQGSLRCTSSNGTDQFYIDGHYISKKNVELVTKVAQREYYERLVPVLEGTIQKLSCVIELYDQHMLEKCVSVLVISRIVFCTKDVIKLSFFLHIIINRIILLNV